MRKFLFFAFTTSVVLHCSSRDFPPVAVPGATDSSTTPTTTPTSTATGPTNCAGEDETGIPKCSWIQIPTGTTKTITGALPTDAGAQVTFELTSVAPVSFTSRTDCETRGIAFTLKKAGIDEKEQPSPGGYWYNVNAKGEWSSAGNGGADLAVAIDPTLHIEADAGADASADAGDDADTGADPDAGPAKPKEATPTFTLGNICKDLYEKDYKSIAVLMTVIHDIGYAGGRYEADFVNQHYKNSALPSGYYVLINR